MPLPVEPDHHAFPLVDSLESRLVALGLTKREYIAIACLQGLLSNPALTGGVTDDCQIAVMYANTLIKELNK